MKLWVRLLFAAILLLMAFFAGTYIFLAAKGKALIIKQLEEASGKKVTLERFIINSPFSLELRNLAIEELLKAESIQLSPSPLSFILKYPVLNRLAIIKPQITYHRLIPKVIDVNTTLNLAPPIADLKKKYPLRIAVKELIVEDGRLNFIDHTVAKENLYLTFTDFMLRVSNFYYLVPHSQVTDFSLKSAIPWQGGQDKGTVEIEGWINTVKKDMKATVTLQGIDGIYLYPYYSLWVDLEKARIEKAKLNFSSDIIGLNNEVTADCHLELTDIVRRPVKEDEIKEKEAKITDAVIDFFRTLNQGRVVLDFRTKTKMDSPIFSFTDIKMAFEDKISEARKATGLKGEHIFGFPAKVVTGTFKGFTDLTSALIVGTVSAGKEIGKAVGAAFKKEKLD